MDANNDPAGVRYTGGCGRRLQEYLSLDQVASWMDNKRSMTGSLSAYQQQSAAAQRLDGQGLYPAAAPEPPFAYQILSQDSSNHLDYGGHVDHYSDFFGIGRSGPPLDFINPRHLDRPYHGAPLLPTAVPQTSPEYAHPARWGALRGSYPPTSAPPTRHEHTHARRGETPVPHLVHDGQYAALGAASTFGSPSSIGLMRNTNQMPFQAGNFVETRQQQLANATIAFEIASRRPALNAQQPAVTVESAESVVCDECGKELKDKAGLRKHKKTHGEDYRPHKCVKCDHPFQHKKDLRRHLKTHIREDAQRREQSLQADGHEPLLAVETYDCPQCDGHFTRSDNRDRHIRTVHENDRSSHIGSRRSSTSRRTASSTERGGKRAFNARQTPRVGPSSPNSLTVPGMRYGMYGSPSTASSPTSDAVFSARSSPMPGYTPPTSNPGSFYGGSVPRLRPQQQTRTGAEQLSPCAGRPYQLSQNWRAPQ